MASNNDFEQPIADRYDGSLEINDGNQGHDGILSNVDSLYYIELKTTRATKKRQFSLGRDITLGILEKYAAGGIIWNDQVENIDYFCPQNITIYLISNYINSVIEDSKIKEDQKTIEFLQYLLSIGKKTLVTRIVKQFGMVSSGAVSVYQIKMYCPIIKDKKHLDDLGNYDSKGIFSLEKSLELGYTAEAHEILKGNYD